MRYALPLLLSAMLLSACDSDDPAETVRIDGRYVADVDLTENATAPAAARAAGACSFTLDVTLSTGAGGAISGAGTAEFYHGNGTECAPQRDVDVTGTFEGGTIEGDVVVMMIALADGTSEWAFEGRVSEDGGTITGSFVGPVGVPVVFERVP